MPTLSSLFTGMDRNEDARISRIIQGDAATFIALVQRIVWGLSQAEIFRVDLDNTLNRLQRQFGECFATHLYTAYALSARDPCTADAALSRAKAMVAPDHSLAYLLPSDSEWNCEVPEQQLVEVIPDRVWRIEGYFPMAGTPFLISSLGTIVRLQNGELVFVNPVAINDSIAARVSEIGAVRFIVSQGKVHSRYIESAKIRFPAAKNLGTPGHLTHPSSASIRFDGLIGTGETLLPDEFAQFPIEGNALEEVVLLHHPTGLLIFQDLIGHNRLTGQGRSFCGRLYGFAFGLDNRIGFLGYQPMMWTNLKQFQSALQSIRNADYTCVTGAHWPVLPDDGAGRKAFDTALDWAIKLQPLAHKWILIRYFARQPGFLRDMIRYKQDT